MAVRCRDEEECRRKMFFSIFMLNISLPLFFMLFKLFVIIVLRGKEAFVHGPLLSLNCKW